MPKKLYTLPKLPYSYKDLEPYISEEQLTIHHSKHHQGYVNGANKLFEKIQQSRETEELYDVKSTLKELSFNMGGHILHSLFWKNMAPEGKGGKPDEIGKILAKEFESLDRFKEEFSKAAVSVEGSGWAALAYDEATENLVIVQIEKHNVNLVPALDIILVIDVWEHAYYLDYKNERKKFVEAFWKIVNWEEVNNRYNELT